jgi:PTS system fructose-specific IIC component
MIRLARYLRPPQVKLELDTRTPDAVPEGWSRERFVWSIKQGVLEELVGLLDTSGRVANANKLLTDLVNREKKSSTGIGEGIAIPHVRTMQAREFAICVARSTPGVEFDALDGAPVRIFFGVIAPPYDDKLYLEVYREIGTLLTERDARTAILEAGTPHEVIKIIADITG